MTTGQESQQQGETSVNESSGNYMDKPISDRHIRLDSVGCVIDKRTGMTYPKMADGETFCNSEEWAVHPSECCWEWWHTLSPEDARTVVDILE